MENCLGQRIWSSEQEELQLKVEYDEETISFGTINTVLKETELVTLNFTRAKQVRDFLTEILVELKVPGAREK